jgi:ribonuclease E
MANKMLIDASHPEETRVVVLRGNRVEEFDFESASKKPLRGNIYLAKVMRVEPSLQAAFVDYGGNRHGFLAFSEIHPDYYQIPVADRQALIEEEARAQRDEEEELSRPPRRSRRYRRGDRDGQRADKRRSADARLSADFGGEAPEATEGATYAEAEEAEQEQMSADSGVLPCPEMTAGESGQDDASPKDADGESATPPAAGGESPVDAEVQSEVDLEQDSIPPEAEPDYGEPLPAAEGTEALTSGRTAPQKGRTSGEAGDEGEEEAAEIEQLGGDALEEMPARPQRPRRQYKIQEVIKRRQVLLVQVVKEERGNKGAALTTYLSLAGRYSVLMPNTARGGGISRKITDPTDRQRLKSIAHELEVPEGMGVIVRTAGAARTKAEVKRDFEYLLRMWETVRETTLRSSAPKLVYEEGSLIKRAIRDLYNKDIDEIVVAGEDAYREAKEFMRLLMPSHAKMVQPFRDPQPMFAKFGVEAQLDAMFSNHVTLKSGGYIVINQAEALVAIDVNSGRSTREHNIEDTALRTNLEAAEEIARQLRLRDLAGLIVIDFIDMEENRNNRLVERRLKEALKNDRARIQIGRMSHFGLLEMSRQRMRTGVLEGSTIPCPHCGGAGMVRSTASIALHVLRGLEDALIKSSDYDITVKTRTAVALYILNQKRSHLRDLEKRFGVSLTIAADDDLTNTNYYSLQRGEPAIGLRDAAVTLAAEEAPSVAPEGDFLSAPSDGPEAEEAASEHVLQAEARSGGAEPVESENEAYSRQRRRRRRRRGRGGEREVSGIAATAPQPPDDALQVVAELGGLRPAASLTNAEPAPTRANEETTVDHRYERRHSRSADRTPNEGPENVAGAAEDTLRIEFTPEPLAETGSETGAPAAEGDTTGGRKRRSRTPRTSRSRGGSRAAAMADVEPPHGAAGSLAKAQMQKAGAEADEAQAPRDVESEPREAAHTMPVDSGTVRARDESPLRRDDSPAHRADDPARPKRTGWWQRARAGWRS